MTITVALKDGSDWTLRERTTATEYVSINGFSWDAETCSFHISYNEGNETMKRRVFSLGEYRTVVFGE